MKMRNLLVVFDAADVDAESAFWAGVLDGTVEARESWSDVVVDGKPVVAVQHAPGHVPPDWPDGNPQQIHLDLWIEDFDAAHEQVMSLGARLLQEASDRGDAEGFWVYADPAGHPFCLCW